MRDLTVATLAVALLTWTLLTPDRQVRAAARQQDRGDQQGATATFRNYNRTFQVELPPDWRQISPGEAVRIGEHAACPPLLRLAAPRSYYAVGPVDRWLAGDFSSAWLYVYEQRDEWHVDDDYETTLRDLWRQHGEANGVRHELSDVHLERLGAQRVECIVATRRTTPAAPAAARVSLDVHAPTARQQLTLSFAAPDGSFDEWRPRFRKWLETLTFARTAKGQKSLGERLWTPILAGSAVSLILLILYHYTRARR